MSDAPTRRPPPGDRGTPHGRPARAATPAAPTTSLDGLLAELDASSTGAELHAVDARADPGAEPGAEHDALAHLGETARALHALVWPVRAADAAAVWDARRRVVRMRAWLRARADVATTASAIALCERALHVLTAALGADQRAAGRRPNDTAEFEAERR